MTVDPRSAEHQMAAQLPAPKTFAPSREDVLSNLAFFFGDPAVPEKLRDYSEQCVACLPLTTPPVSRCAIRLALVLSATR